MSDLTGRATAIASGDERQQWAVRECGAAVQKDARFYGVRCAFKQSSTVEQRTAARMRRQHSRLGSHCAACMLHYMDYITTLFARKMVAAAGDSIDASRLLARVGIDLEGQWDPKDMISAADYYDMLESIAAQVDVTELPLRVGASMRLDEYGALGLAFKAAKTLGASCARIERYARLWTSVVEYELRSHPLGALLIMHRAGARRLGLRLSNEATLASSISIARQVSSVPVTPLEVFIQHAAPKSVAAHEAWFGCPVRFDADLDAILYSTETLLQPNLLGDDGISRYLISDLEAELSQIKAEVTLVDQAKDAIAQALSEGSPKMAQIAGGLGLSARSFHRRLSEHGMSFKALTEETRRHLAEGLLRDERHSLSEIAFLTGFSEQSAFTRAFKRWVGHTPASYRKTLSSR